MNCTKFPGRGEKVINDILGTWSLIFCAEAIRLPGGDPERGREVRAREKESEGKAMKKGA